jgi:CRISPR-associated protein Cmr6
MRKFILELAGRLDSKTKQRPDDRRGQHREKGGGQHPGLLLQRYLCENATGEGGNPEEKRAILQAAISAAGNPEVRALYRAAYERWKDELDRDKKRTKSDFLETPEHCRLIVGLGTENVLETGIRLHHTYGMPILPGSALKGLAAHYCNQVWGQSDSRFKKPTPDDDKAYREYLAGKGPKPEDNFHRLLFGSTDDGGCITFHDAWFIPDSENQPLRLDVMTPHHPQWLDGSVPPTDFDSPVPVPFLSVAGRFHVAVSWHGPESDHADSWRDRAMTCLREALFHWGIGGKTSSGYGRFDEEKWKTKTEARLKDEARRKAAAEKEAALAAMSPIERSIQNFLENHPNKAEKREWIKLLEELKNPNGRFTSTEDRLEVARRVKAGMQADVGKPWKGKGKDAERKKYIQDILGES